jgi:hypothetical protein
MMKLGELQRYVPEQDRDSEMYDAVRELFTYHAWTPEMITSGEIIRATLMEAYRAILRNAPSCPTRTRALNMLVDARMLANAAITFKGEV